MSYIYTKFALIEATHLVHPGFFEPATMRFFNSRLCAIVPGPPERCYFVTSEKGPDRVRRYTIRLLSESGVETVGGFQAYAKRGTAVVAAHRLHHAKYR